MAYIDTSVLVAYYCPEAISDKVEAMLLSMERPAVSQLTVVELASAISRKIREGTLTRESGEEIISLFNTHITENRFAHYVLQSEHFTTAFKWISRLDTPLRTLDALHLAVAKNCKMPIITSDSHLAQSARILGVDFQYITNTP
ncbi:MAG: type II toxin-antitoxin system VapC family toxin [Desulfobacteraceae bacterium]|jgi:hypothetical protein